MNIYRHAFVVDCPNNGQAITYALEIATPRVIMAEDIVAQCRRAAMCEKPYHETMADFLAAALGGRQRMIAHHHGVEIETRRG